MSTTTIDCYLDDERTLGDDVRAGLTRAAKELPPKHLYDRRGAALFDRICELPEYYPTRAERAILARRAGEIAQITRARELVELGSGTASKTRVLLDAMELRRYVAVDVTEAVVRDCVRLLCADYDDLAVHGVVGDFERHLRHLPERLPPRVIALLGGTIGNFTPEPRRRLLARIARQLGPEDHLLLGTDLVKDVAVLEAAYDDSAGVTAEFNRNVLHVINRELQADFDPEGFEHVALFDARHEWIEMRLRARRAHTVRVRALDLAVSFGAGEEIRTEISAKFTLQRVAEDLDAAGLRLTHWMCDADERFAVSLARPA